jgi:hypothetical protein
VVRARGRQARPSSRACRNRRALVTLVGVSTALDEYNSWWRHKGRCALRRDGGLESEVRDGFEARWSDRIGQGGRRDGERIPTQSRRARSGEINSC